MKLYIRASLNRSVSGLNAIKTEIQKALKSGSTRIDVFEYLDDMFDEDRISDAEYDELQDWIMHNTNDPTYEAVRNEYPLTAEFIYSDGKNHYSVYDVSEQGATRLALLDDIRKVLVVICEAGEQSTEDFVDSCIQDWKENYVDKDKLEMISLYE